MDHYKIVESVEELTPENAMLEVSRSVRDEFFRNSIIYAAFDADGVCRYVGMGGGAGRPLADHHHILDYDPEWTVLRIWRVKVDTYQELLALEQQAIELFEPLLNNGGFWRWVPLPNVRVETLVLP